MARRPRKQARSGRRAGERVLIAEIYCMRDPEILQELAAEALDILENPEADDLAKSEARIQLATSAMVYKYWRFFMPPKVEVEFVFEHQQYANEFAEIVGKFIDARKATRIIDGRAYPSVRVDWQRWHELKLTFGGPVDPPDVIAENFVEQKNPKKALERLMQDLLLFSLTADADFRPADEAEEE